MKNISDHIYYFDKPVIGYCPVCDVLAVYSSERGLHCPKCKSSDISVFEWNESSRHPEDEEDREQTWK